MKAVLFLVVASLMVSQIIAITCNPGQYDNSGTCTACPKGKFVGNSSTVAPFSCNNCAPGYYTNNTGSSACAACPAGYYSDAGFAICNSCGLGQFQDKPASASCKDCPPGSFSNTAAPTCTPCPLGQFSTKPRTVVCSACGPAFFTKDTGATVCLSCSLDQNNVQCASSIVNRIGLALNTTQSMMQAPAKGQFTQDIATTVKSATSRIAVIASSPSSQTIMGATLNYQKVVFDILPPATSSDTATPTLFDALAAAFALNTSALYSGTWTKYTLNTFSLDRQILLKCADGTIQAACPQPKDTSLTAGAIVGIVLGVIAFLVIVAVLCYYRKKQD